MAKTFKFNADSDKHYQQSKKQNKLAQRQQQRAVKQAQQRYSSLNNDKG